MQAVAYSLPLGVANAVLVIVGVTLFLVGSHTNFVLLGPSPSIVFAGFTIDTWPRWSAVVAFSILSQVSICINVNTLEPYITNVVRDHKTTRVDPATAHAIVQLKTAYDWILGILNTSLWITLQVQFLGIALLTDLVVTAVMTRRFLREKKSEPLLHK